MPGDLLLNSSKSRILIPPFRNCFSVLSGFKFLVEIVGKAAYDIQFTQVPEPVLRNGTFTVDDSGDISGKDGGTAPVERWIFGKDESDSAGRAVEGG